MVAVKIEKCESSGYLHLQAGFERGGIWPVAQRDADDVLGNDAECKCSTDRLVGRDEKSGGT
jgi:hypothetical protein